MFAVNGKKPDALFPRAARDELARHHHDFFRGERDVHSLLDRGHRRLKARHPDSRYKTYVGVVLLDCANRRVFAAIHLSAELAGKLLAFIHRTVRGHCNDGEFIRMRTYDVDGIHADRPRRAQDDYPLSHAPALQFVNFEP